MAISIGPVSRVGAGAVNEAALDELLGQLERLRTWSPRVVSKLESFLRTDDEWALFRASPFAFAAERGVAEDEAVDLFLCASKVGIFQMTWNLLCAGCGAAVHSFTTLRRVCAVFHCALCTTDIETRLDEFVQVGFTVSPSVRAIAAHQPLELSVEDYYFKYHFTREARISAGGERFRDLAQQATLQSSYIDPGQTVSITVNAEPGGLVPHDAVSGSIFIYFVDPNITDPSPVQRLVLSAGSGAVPEPKAIGPGPVTLEVKNDLPQRASISIFTKAQAVLDDFQERASRGESTAVVFDKFLTGRRLLTSTTFRTLFVSETIHSADGLSVRDISILFTDLKGSTDLYDRIGDLKAFALVNQHFDRLGRAITRHGGAVVKTIGDAVMASFEEPEHAVRAARDMLAEIAAFNREVGEREIVLKVGVHRGASIAVTLNDRLDFFGQTVNIAARVQGLADADEIYLTEDVYRAAGVRELLTGLDVTSGQATLKGVQRPVSVFRVASRTAE